MSDAEFLAAFEDCSLDNHLLRHREHVRLTWLYLQQWGEPETRVRLPGGIRKYAAAQGASEKYHHTVTLAWIRLIAAAARSCPTLEATLSQHPELLDKNWLHGFYSEAVLSSVQARRAWVEPDLAPLPPQAA